MAQDANCCTSLGRAGVAGDVDVAYWAHIREGEALTVNLHYQGPGLAAPEGQRADIRVLIMPFMPYADPSDPGYRPLQISLGTAEPDPDYEDFGTRDAEQVITLCYHDMKERVDAAFADYLDGLPFADLLGQYNLGSGPFQPGSNSQESVALAIVIEAEADLELADSGEAGDEQLDLVLGWEFDVEEQDGAVCTPLP